MDRCRVHLAICHSFRLLVSQSSLSLLFILADDTDRWGPVAWIIISEVFPLGLRAKGVSIGGSSNWLNNVRRSNMDTLRIEANRYTVRGRSLHLTLH